MPEPEEVEWHGEDAGGERDDAGAVGYEGRAARGEDDRGWRDGGGEGGFVGAWRSDGWDWWGVCRGEEGEGEHEVPGGEVGRGAGDM